MSALPGSGGEGEPRVVHEEERFLVAWKPAGLHTAPGALDSGPCLADWVFALHPEIGALGGEAAPRRRPGEGGLVHRLDRDTSGLVLFARDGEALAFLLAEQAAGRIEKEYLLGATVSEAPLPGSRPGRGPLPEGGIADPGPRGFISCRFRPYGPRGARVACIAPDAMPARGRTARAAREAPLYRTELLGRDDDAGRAVGAACPGALGLRVRIATGFRHQIRAQLAWIGLPLLGDGLYGGLPAQRLFLEAVSLRFRAPGAEGGHRVIAADVAFAPPLRYP